MVNNGDNDESSVDSNDEYFAANTIMMIMRLLSEGL
jgi:hypothetical protein